MQSHVESLSAEDLIAVTRLLAWKSNVMEADLLVHIGEIDARKLYLNRAYPSMFEFCVRSLGFSEDAAYNRIAVARAARRLPAILESIRSGQVHLFGMRLLSAHLTEPNHQELLSRAAGKTRREIEELIASIAPRPAVPATIRKLPDRSVLPDASPLQPGQPASGSRGSTPTGAPPSAENESRSTAAPSTANGAAAANGVPPPASATSPSDGCAPSLDGARGGTLPASHRPVVEPLSSETFRIQFTATRSVRDKLREAQDLLAHTVAPGDLNAVFERALDAIIEKLKKRRFAVGGIARPARESGKPSRVTADPVSSAKKQCRPPSRYIRAWMKRTIHERDGGRCTFVDPSTGRRCTSTRALEYDHVKGFAIVNVHDLDDITLRCRAHNLHRARQMFGSEFIERKRAERVTRSRTRERSDPVPPSDEPPKEGSG